MTQTNASPRFVAREWNACGATQFYGKDRKRSYIVEVSLSEDVHGDLLQQAVDKALQRLPYYGSTFVRKKGLYYYADPTWDLGKSEAEYEYFLKGAADFPAHPGNITFEPLGNQFLLKDTFLDYEFSSFAYGA